MPFYLSRRAKADLKNIARYTEEKWGRQQRNTYLQRIDSTFHELAVRPEKGQSCEDIRQGCKKYRIHKHLIYYRITQSNNIEIVRVLHGSMDIEGQLNE